MCSKVTLLGFCLWSTVVFSQKINREEVFKRHEVHINEVDTLNSLSLGNGKFAMTMDVTGLQTFPEFYKKGIPLGTQSEWGWHSFPTSKKYTIEQTLAPIKSHGREVLYAKQWPAGSAEAEATNYIRQNPHRIHLANIGWQIIKKDGTTAMPSDIKAINQRLDMWSGELISEFEVEGEKVRVITLVDQNNDLVAVKVNSPLLKAGRLKLQIKFPYPTNKFEDEAAFYDTNEPKRLSFSMQNTSNLTLTRKLDDLNYSIQINSENVAIDPVLGEYGYVIAPKTKSEEWAFSCDFRKGTKGATNQSFETIRNNTKAYYKNFWNTGAMLDFGKTKDPSAHEIERRMVLSLYLTKINCGGDSPPQETGLTYNSWYGKPHMEMIWWHGVHFALWGRPQILEKQISWYFRAEEGAKKIAQRQGFAGLRWQKMTDNEGQETPSSVGSYLIWQQPHLIYFVDLLYNENSDKKVLEKYQSLVEKAADFMADFAYFDPKLKRYILGPGVIAAQERFDPKVTFNPTYELAYWRWALEKAQDFRQILGKIRNQKWDEVLNNLSVLPVKEDIYFGAESATDSYTNPYLMTDHPSVLGAYGMLPATKGLNPKIMQNTFDLIWKSWHWNDTWGWDFPLVALTAARLKNPEKAIEALLMPIRTNTYLKNGHNYQDERLRLYLPGNGGFLTALAMLSAGSKDQPTPMFPKAWTVKMEGMKVMP